MMNHVLRATGGRLRHHRVNMRDSTSVLVDIKTPVNLWSYDRFASRGVAPSPEERDFVFSSLNASALAKLQAMWPEFKP
jgi:hypothetical protein